LDGEFCEIARYCDEHGIEFLASPWDGTAVDFLEGLDLPAYKIGSPDMTNFVLLEHVLETGKPLIVSTGMADEDEIERTVAFLREHNAEFALLHCRSTYPAPFHNLNLSFMAEMEARYRVPVGY
jgi:N-acetylneuraminate synthase